MGELFQNFHDKSQVCFLNSLLQAPVAKMCQIIYNWLYLATFLALPISFTFLSHPLNTYKCIKLSLQSILLEGSLSVSLSLNLFLSLPPFFPPIFCLFFLQTSPHHSSSQMSPTLPFFSLYKEEGFVVFMKQASEYFCMSP